MSTLGMATLGRLPRTGISMPTLGRLYPEVDSYNGKGLDGGHRDLATLVLEDDERVLRLVAEFMNDVFGR